MQGNKRVGPTALYTAQAWREGCFENAEFFDDRLGRWMYRAGNLARRLGSPLLPAFLKDFNEYLFIRHRAFEDRLEALLPDMVIEVAAGLSPRGLTYSRRWPNTIYQELDLPNMVAAKRQRLHGMGLPPNYYLAESDILSEGFVDSLPVRPTQGQHVLVITEGLMDYLSMEEKQRAWENIVKLLAMSHPDSRYLTECWPKHRVMPGSGMGKWAVNGLGLLVGRRMGENLFDNREAADAGLRQAGFKTVSRPDLVTLTRNAGLDPRACPFILFECGV